MTGGFAVLAYPAKYRSSGVMTFLVNTDGDVMQKDLGPKTDELAEGDGQLQSRQELGTCAVTLARL